MILALLLVVPLPTYAGSTPSDAEYANVSRAVDQKYYNTKNIQATYYNQPYYKN